MYVRSSGRRIIPPDYGGTALVIGQNGNTSDGDRRIRRDNSERERKSSDIGSVGRAPFGIDGQREYDGSKHAAFLERAGGFESFSAEECSDAEKETGGDVPENRKPCEDGKKPSLLGLFDADKLKSDDLLLLGLIFLLLSESGKGDGEASSREVLLLLAVLYLSGI